MASTSGRRVVVPLTNKSGGGVIAGDVVVIDTSNDDAFTTTTTAAYTGMVGVAQETIANNAVGRICLFGEVALVNVSASVTRGYFGATHTVAKQAASAGASRTIGTFVQFKTGGTTPKGFVFNPDLLGSSLTNPMTTKGDVILGDTGGTPSRLAAGTSGYLLTSNGAGAFPSWQVAPSTGAMVRLDEKIAAGGATASFDFTSISAGYRALQIHLMIRGLVSATQAGLYLRFNNDSGANYNCSRLYDTGAGGAASNDSFDAQTAMQNLCHVTGATGTANVFSEGSILIPQYANTLFQKMVEAHSIGWSSTSSTTYVSPMANGGKWASTAAINQVTLFISSGNITDGSVATLYGIL